MVSGKWFLKYYTFSFRKQTILMSARIWWLFCSLKWFLYYNYQWSLSSLLWQENFKLKQIKLSTFFELFSFRTVCTAHCWNYIFITWRVCSLDGDGGETMARISVVPGLLWGTQRFWYCGWISDKLSSVCQTLILTRKKKKEKLWGDQMANLNFTAGKSRAH